MDAKQRIQLVRIGSKPMAYFNANDTCVFNFVSFFDSSYTSVGTINSWYWDFDNGLTSTLQNPTHHYAATGNYLIKLCMR